MIFSKFKWNAETILELGEPLKAYIYYRHERLNLLTGFPELYSIKDFIKDLEKIPLQGRVAHPKVFHFYYEFGLIQMGLGNTVDESKPLAVEVEYRKSRKKPLPRPKLERIILKSLERPTWTEYKEAFQKVQAQLLDGNCYQVNLTFPYDFMTEEILDPRDVMDFFFSRKGTGAFAHGTYLGEEMFLSNSPECLFQYRDKEIFTMPIKGTINRQGKSLKEAWYEMLKSSKEEGELLMITDLLRNDLNRLGDLKARVVRLRAPLVVPNLLHQYSLITCPLSREVTLRDSMKALFPGGSITGAPKKRVMEIIQEIEPYERGIYCGSTLLCYQDKKVASINIRTASINLDERIWRYGAGGGITLLSRAVDEFKEMEGKVASFLTLIETPGY